MKIAVIGEYESPAYKDLLLRVKIIKPEEEVLDLSRHHNSCWSKMLESRFGDIRNAHLVVISVDWHNHFDAKRDITYAQSLNKECFIDFHGQFLPFPEFAQKL
jgi:hypothetical protein